jgi:hypothetical protein
LLDAKGKIFQEMKKLLFVSGILLLNIYHFSQQTTHEVSVVNITVPVRVFKGDSFVDNLTINDFEVYEDGKLQKIEAVYFIREMNILKEEGEKKLTPKVSRQFVLLFEMKRYLPKLEKAMDYFFNQVITPEDNLTIVTPIKSYKVNCKLLETLPRKQIAAELRDKLRADIIQGSYEYRSLITHLNDARLNPSLDDEERANLCKELAYKLKSLSCLEEKRLLEFAEELKKIEGQKHVFFFYQKENFLVMKEILDFDSFDPAVFDLFNPDQYFDIEKVKQVFSDASISCNFLYLTEKTLDTDFFSMEQIPERSSTVDMDNSAKFFDAFKKIAQATGGATESSANVASAFKKVLDVSKSYYLIYYAPQNYQADGKFHTISVKVKSGKYSIMHRIGYLAK